MLETCLQEVSKLLSYAIITSLHSALPLDSKPSDARIEKGEVVYSRVGTPAFWAPEAATQSPASRTDSHGVRPL